LQEANKQYCCCAASKGTVKLQSVLSNFYFSYCTFSSKALWCSNRDFRALRTSTSLETPEGDCACRFTTVILSDLSCLETRHSKCSNNSYWIWYKRLLVFVQLYAMEILTTKCMVQNGNLIGSLFVGETVGIIDNSSRF